MYERAVPLAASYAHCVQINGPLQNWIPVCTPGDPMLDTMLDPRQPADESDPQIYLGMIFIASGGVLPSSSETINMQIPPKYSGHQHAGSSGGYRDSQNFAPVARTGGMNPVTSTYQQQNQTSYPLQHDRPSINSNKGGGSEISSHHYLVQPGGNNVERTLLPATNG
ncbi:unnamed protein product, partial [Amoebophrya sp. A25]|eukprot:GSA25T00012384001.1